jgi:hypothetical protein
MTERKRHRTPLCGFKVKVVGQVDPERFIRKMTDLMQFRIDEELRRQEQEQRALDARMEAAS